MFYTALLGHPVEHSVSPILFNYLAQLVGIEYAHLKIDVKTRGSLPTAINSLKALGFAGANITLPYKVDMISHCDHLNKEAASLGAINTIVFKDDCVIGYNTDTIGALRAIETQLRKLEEQDQVLIIGAGGAARAIAFAIHEFCQNLTILNVNPRTAQVLKDALFPRTRKVQCYLLDETNLLKGLIESNFIINATPVGMYPSIGERIIPYRILRESSEQSDFRQKFFFDAIFNPFETHLLLDADTLEAKVCSGMYMMIFQAIKAFELWTKFSLDESAIDINALIKNLAQFTMPINDV